MNLEIVEHELTATVAPVVRALRTASEDLPAVMVVGSTCRDALHLGAGFSTPTRRTDDLDIALALPQWDRFGELTSRLTRVAGASSRIRFVVAGRAVDLIPFGAQIESPDGEVTPSGRDDSLSVFGFQDVMAAGYRVVLADDLEVCLPTVPGFALLKLRAWADRSQVGEYKDAGDLACTMYWYQNSSQQAGTSASVRDRLYGTATGEAHLLAADSDEPVAAVRLLVADALSVLTLPRQGQLRAVWASTQVDDARLAAALDNPLLPGWPRRGSERLLHYARAVRSVMAHCG